VSNPTHTSEEVERLKVRFLEYDYKNKKKITFLLYEICLLLQPSYSTEELNQEMANLEGLMKDLNAITASEFEC